MKYCKQCGEELTYQKSFCNYNCAAVWNREQPRKEYYKNPNHCKYCKNIIEIAPHEQPNVARNKVFCGHSCAAKYNNLHHYNNVRYDWKEISNWYNEDRSRTYRDVVDKFGMQLMSITKARRRGDFVPKYPRKSKFINENTPRQKIIDRLSLYKSRGTVRRVILKYKLLPYKCAECGLETWRDKEIALELEHKNGIADDHRFENLEFLCPNCHAQTPTHAGRNSHKNDEE